MLETIDSSAFSIMASLKIILRKKQNKDGSYPLVIRITKDRKSSYIHLGHNILESEWDNKNQRVKKSYPNATRMNNLLLAKLSEANAKLLDLEVQKNDFSSRNIRNTIKSSAESGFFDQAKVYIDNLKANGKYNRSSSDEPRINRFKEFLKSSDISFKEITIPLLNKFRSYLKVTRNISERTIINHLIVIRTIYNQAIKANLADQKHYPFGKDKIVIKFPDSKKLGFTSDEVKKVENTVLDNPNLNHARNLWLFSFYFAGMRASDVLRLKWTDVQDNRLYYIMGKNSKGDSLKVPDKAAKILAQYLSQKDDTDLVFPELKDVVDFSNRYNVEMRIKTKLHALNDSLKEVQKKIGIQKPMSMHIARHSFGNISGDKIPIQMLQKLYRHTSITTTIGYQSNFIHKDVDEALDAVIGN